MSANKSAAQYQPNVASNTTSGSGPAAATAAAMAIGSLSMWTFDNNSPSAFFRTITDRRRCRSIPTYSRCTGTSLFRRRGVALVSLSVATLDTPRREEVPFLTAEEVVTIGLSLDSRTRRRPDQPAGPRAQQRRPAASSHHLATGSEG